MKKTTDQTTATLGEKIKEFAQSWYGSDPLGSELPSDVERELDEMYDIEYPFDRLAIVLIPKRTHKGSYNLKQFIAKAIQQAKDEAKYLTAYETAYEKKLFQPKGKPYSTAQRPSGNDPIMIKPQTKGE